MAQLNSHKFVDFSVDLHTCSRLIVFFRRCRRLAICQSKLVTKIICKAVGGHFVSWQIFPRQPQRLHAGANRKALSASPPLEPFVVSLDSLDWAELFRCSQQMDRWEVFWNPTPPWTHTKRERETRKHIFERPLFPAFTANKAALWHHSYYAPRQTARPTGPLWCPPSTHLPTQTFTLTSSGASYGHSI